MSAPDRRFDVLLFDADGTLFDFERAEEHSLSATFAGIGIPFRAEYLGEYRTVNAELWRAYEQGRIGADFLRTERFRRFCERIGADADPRDFAEGFLRHLGGSGFLIDHAFEVVKALARDHAMAIVTNGLKEVQRSRFERSGLKPFFEAIVVSEEVGSQKPLPAMFEAALARLGHRERERALMIGDSLSSDIRGGADFGIRTCWFNPSGRSAGAETVPTYVIADLRELLAICSAEAPERADAPDA